MTLRLSALALAAMIFLTARSADEAITYSSHIAGILYKNCAQCHHPGEVAPFSLLTYEDASKRAKMIARVTASRYMPPFKAEPGAGEFRDICRLTDAEIASIRAWVDAGAPEGDPKTAPRAPTFTNGWTLGTPDMVVTMPQAFSIPAEGKDVFQCFVLPADMPDERYLVAYEFRSGNPKVVHHAIVSQDNTGEAIANDKADPAIGYKSNGTGTGLKAAFNKVLGVWTPGVVPGLLPEGVALRLEKNAVIVLQIHYHPSGKLETDQSSVGLYFSKTPPAQFARYTTLFQTKFAIPPGDAHHAVEATRDVHANGRVIAIAPHMHLIGREMKVTATAPDGTVTPMVWVKNWDFNWQHQYFYAKPFPLVKGTKVKLEAIFDNSAENANNPSHPPKLVKFGEGTNDEMAGVILLTVDGAKNYKVATVDPAALARYVGKYALDIPTTLDISQDGGALKALVDGKGKKVPLTAVSDTEFISHEPEAKLTFRKDSNGEFGLIVVEVNGKHHAGKRVKN